MADAQKAIQIDANESALLARVLIDARSQATADRADYIAQLKKNRALLKPHQPRLHPPFEGACDLHVPLLRYAVNALVAREYRALTGVKPYFYVEGRSKLAQQCAPHAEEFLYQQCVKQIEFNPFARQVIKAANEDGTAVAYVRWEQRYLRKLQYEVIQDTQIDPETGAELETKGKVRSVRNLVMDYNGPVLDLIPIDKFGVYPAANGDVQAAQGVYLDLSLTGNDLINGVLAGDYDKNAVDKVRAWSGEVTNTERAEDENREISVTDASIAPDAKFQSKLFDITEWYWRYASNDKDPAEDWLITIHEPTMHVLRAIPNPWGHGKRPIVPCYILPPTYGVIGQSLPDLAGDPQRFITMILRLMVDATAKRVHPEIYWGNGVTPDEFAKMTKPENRGPGKNHKLSADDPNKVIKTLDSGYDPNTALPILESMRQWAERASGVNDTMLGKTSPGAQTATEIENMLTEGQEMVMDMTDMLSVGFTQIAELLLALDYEYSGEESIQELWAMANPNVTFTPEVPGAGMGAGIGMQQGKPGMQVPLDAMTALSQSYDVLAAGSMATANKAMRKQKAMDLFIALKDDPFNNADPTGKRQYAIRNMLLVDGFDLRLPQSLIGTEEEAHMVPMIAQIGQMLDAAAQMAGAMGQPGDDGGGEQGQPIPMGLGEE